MKMLKSVRKEVLALGSYAEGKPPKGGAAGKRIKMASNENLFGPSPKALEALRQSAGSGLEVYPDSKMRELKAAVSEYWKLKGVEINPQNLLFVDGSGEVLNMLISAFLKDGDTMIIPENSFILYSLLSLSKGIKVMEVKRNGFRADPAAMLRAEKKAGKAGKAGKSKMIIIANPDNPTSTFLTQDEIKDFMREAGEETPVVIDEAYIHFAGLENSAIHLLKKYPNLIVVFTFSKAYGLAGLRVGYAAMHPRIAEQVEKIRLPFNLGTLQQAVAREAMKDDAYVGFVTGEIRSGREYLQNEFTRLGISHQKAYGNFLFADFGKNWKAMIAHLDQNGISVRSLTAFGFTGNHVRVTVGKKEDNEYFIRTLKEGIFMINTADKKEK